MAIIAKYKFDSSIYANYKPRFDNIFTNYTIEDVDNGDGIITRTISSDGQKPTVMQFGAIGGTTDRERSLLEVIECDTSKLTDVTNMFKNCSSLTSLDLSNFDASNVTGMDWMFLNCTLLTSLKLLHATSSTINKLLASLGTSVARTIYYSDAPLNELTVQDNITYKKYELIMATFPYTLNKLPNGVADYIDVVNKVHVQRVGRVVFDG